MILDQKANSAVKSVLGWKVLNGDWLARPDAKRSQCGAQSFLEVVLPSSQGARSHSHVLRPRDRAGEVVGQVHRGLDRLGELDHHHITQCVAVLVVESVNISVKCKNTKNTHRMVL